MLPTVHYNMGGIATNYHGEALTKKNGNGRHDRPRADGARRSRLRVGAWRQPARLEFADRSRGVRPRRRACAAPNIVEPGDKQPELPKDSADMPLSRLDRFRHASGGTPTAKLRLQHAEGDAGQLRGVPHRRGARGRATSSFTRSISGMADIKVTDRSLIWNSDLVETLEFDNLIAQAVVTMDSASEPHREPRRACARGFSRARRQELDEAHAGVDRRARQGAASTTARCTPTRSPTKSPISSRKRGFTDGSMCHGRIHASEELQGDRRQEMAAHPTQAQRT